VFRVVALSKSFGALQAVQDLYLDVPANSVTSIIGPNGAGKSTVFNLISGALTPDSGAIMFQDLDITGYPPYVINRLGVARSFQITNIFFGLTVLENLRLATQSSEPRRQFLRPLRRFRRPQQRASQLVAEFGLADRAEEIAGNLSHGDQRRLEIAICMASAPILLLLDEPTQGMSPTETMETDELIKSLKRQVAILLIEHDIDLVMGVSDNVIVMHQGRKLAEGPPDEIRRNATVQDAYLGRADADT